MKPCHFRRGIAVLVAVLSAVTAIHDCLAEQKKSVGIDTAQVPKWTSEDLNFFLHGSMSTEVGPEPVLRAFIKIYPDLFPREDLTYLGLIPDSDFGWPIGFSRKDEVQHLGSLRAVGLNCAACHVAEIHSLEGAAPVRVLGATSHFDAEAFFGVVILATFRTADPANMKRFASAYLASVDPDAGESTQELLANEWERQKEKIATEMKADPFGSKDVEPGALHQIEPGALVLDDEILEHEKDLAAFSHSILKLFHNMRAALHIPDQLDQAAAKRGAAHNTANCVSCHGGAESDKRLYSVAEVGTDPHRAELFTKEQAARFNKFLAELEATGYQPSKEEGLRSTGKYSAASMDGVWARSPYLHNGSVRTMQELLTPPAQRAKTFHRGSRDYDATQLGYTDAGPYLFDTSSRGNSNAGHNYGTALTADQKHDLLEYLKTL